MLSAAPLLIIKGVEVLKFWVLACFLNQTGLECLKKAQKNKSSFSEIPKSKQYTKAKTIIWEQTSGRCYQCHSCLWFKTFYLQPLIGRSGVVIVIYPAACTLLSHNIIAILITDLFVVEVIVILFNYAVWKIGSQPSINNQLILLV